MTEIEIIEKASGLAMFEDISHYLGDAGILMDEGVIKSLQIKCNYWFKVASMQGTVRHGEWLKKIMTDSFVEPPHESKKIPWATVEKWSGKRKW